MGLILITRTSDGTKVVLNTDAISRMQEHGNGGTRIDLGGYQEVAREPMSNIIGQIRQATYTAPGTVNKGISQEIEKYTVTMTRREMAKAQAHGEDDRGS